MDELEKNELVATITLLEQDVRNLKQEVEFYKNQRDVASGQVINSQKTIEYNNSLIEKEIERKAFIKETELKEILREKIGEIIGHKYEEYILQ